MAKMHSRSLWAYHLHVHKYPGTDKQQVLDYEDFFNWMISENIDQPVLRRYDRLIAIAETKSIGRYVALLFVSGEQESSVLSLNLETFGIAEQSAEDGQVFVQSRWVIVDPTTRTIVFEVNRPTVGLDDVKYYLLRSMKKYARTDSVEMEISQAIDKGILQAIDKFERIREASITLTRPNSDWSDVINDWGRAIESSGAQSVSLAANASRGQSLSKDKGVVRTIVDVVKAPYSFVKNAYITGKYPNEENERTVSLRNNRVKGSTLVNPEENRIEQLESMIVTVEEVVAEASNNSFGDDTKT